MNRIKKLFPPALLRPRAQAAPGLGQRAEPAQTLVVDLLDNDLADQLAPGSMDFTHEDCISFSATEWLRIWYIRRWPRELRYESWQALLRFPADLRISLFMEPLSPGLVSPQLERRETAIQSKRFLRIYQRRDPSPTEDKLLQEIREERQLIEIDQDPFYYLTVAVGVYGDSYEHLNIWSMELERYCRNIGLLLDRARWDQEPGLNALLPFNMNTLGDRHRNARLDALVNTFPWLGDEIVMPKGIFYGYDTQSQMAVVLDPFMLENPNCILIGTSGGGKSYWMKDTIEQFLLDGARVFVLDIEDEYRHLCRDLGGLYLDMNIVSPNKINVLDINPYEIDGLGGAFEAFKGWFLTVLQRSLSPEENEVLDTAYFAAFEKCGILKDQPETYTSTAPLLSDLHQALLDVAKTSIHRDHARRLASALSPMAQGGLAAAFNEHTNIDVRSNPLIVFGFSGVQPTLMPRRIRQIQQFTWGEVLHAAEIGQRTLEIVDEAWWLLENPNTAEDLCIRARRFRKKGAALFVATQHPSDFVANRHAHSILAIVGTHLLFQQNDTLLDQIGTIFQLTGLEKRAIGQLEPGHYFLKTSKLRMLMYRPMLKSRHQLYTTRPEERILG